MNTPQHQQAADTAANTTTAGRWTARAKRREEPRLEDLVDALIATVLGEADPTVEPHKEARE